MGTVCARRVAQLALRAVRDDVTQEPGAAGGQGDAGSAGVRAAPLPVHDGRRRPDGHNDRAAGVLGARVGGGAGAVGGDPATPPALGVALRNGG